MTVRGVDDDFMAEHARNAELRQNQASPLQPGGGGGTLPPMSDRVTRLETHMEYVHRDLGEIKTDLKTLIDRTADLPTKADLWAWKWQWTALAVAVIAIVVGGIIGGLSWIKPDAPFQIASPTPIVITLPAPAKH